jgi:hypothetical protein
MTFGHFSDRKSIFSALRAGSAAIAFGVVVGGGAAVGAPVVTKATGGAPDTLADNQAETGYNVSVFPDKRRVECTTYNDGTGESPAFVTFTSTQRTVRPGFSNLGWSSRVRTPADPNPLWAHNKVRPPAGISALWGDPAIASNPAAPGIVFISSLAVPNEKFPLSGSIVGGVGGSCSPLGGACVARSTDGGVSFSIVDCFRDQTPVMGSTCVGTGVPTNGHFWDGSSMAVTQTGSVFSAFASFIDTELDREATWAMDDVTSNATHPFHPDTTVMGNVGSLAPVGILEGIDSHVRLRADGPSLWKMSVNANGGTVLNRSQEDLKVNIRERNGAPVLLAADALSEFAIDAFSTGDVRTGPQFAFDIGLNESGQKEMRFVYIVGDSSGIYLRAGFCAPDLSSCTRPAAWRTTPFNGPAYFHPAIKFGHDPETNQNRWKITFMGRNLDTVAVFAADLVRPDLVPASPSFTPTGLVISAVTPFQTPCPDLRAAANAGAGYWGDYDDMGYDACSNTFSRAFADSSLGCSMQQEFNSSNVHVSVVEIPGDGGLSALTVNLTGNVHIVDQENWPWPNEIGNHAVAETCTVSASAPVDSHIFWSRCTGDEVVVNLRVTCTLVNGDVSVAVASELREGDGCSPTQELEDSETQTATVLASGGTVPINIDLTHDCVNCGDHAEVRINAGIPQRVCMTP